MNTVSKKSTNPVIKALSVFKNKKVLIAIFITLLFLILFRIASTIPMPFIHVSQSTSNSSESFLDMMNLLGGGGLSQISLFAIGVSPYITAQIIIQLLSTDLIPPLARLAKSGEKGRKKIEVITRVVTLPLAIIQAYAIITLIATQQQAASMVSFSSSMPFEVQSPMFYFFYITLMTVGTYVAIFIADLITKRGVGNGINVLILAGVLSTFFSSFQVVYDAFGNITANNKALLQVVSFLVYFLLYILLLFGVIFINGSVRKIPIQQVGQSLSKNVDELSYLPIKINAVGIIPVIFASSIMTIPSTIAQFIPSNSSAQMIINDYFSLNSIVGVIIYFGLIILFTFFYSYVQLNSEQISTNFQKSGRFIPGIKMGKDTTTHIAKVIFRINWIGAPLLAFIASLPYVISIISSYASNGTVVIPTTAALGGTGIVIIVSSTQDIWSSIKSAATSTNYQYQRKEIEQSIINNSSKDESKLW